MARCWRLPVGTTSHRITPFASGRLNPAKSLPASPVIRIGLAGWRLVPKVRCSSRSAAISRSGSGVWVRNLQARRAVGQAYCPQTCCSALQGNIPRRQIGQKTMSGEVEMNRCEAGITVMHRPQIRAFLIGDAGWFRPDDAVDVTLDFQFVAVDADALSRQPDGGS